MNMKKIFTVLALAACFAVPGVVSDNCVPCAQAAESAVFSARKANVEAVVFKTKLHCENCAKKVVENISFVKGVKDLSVSLEKQEIQIKYDASKTSVETLQKEINKLGYPAVVKSKSE